METGYVYLVDDNPEIRDHLGDLLRRQGHVVETCADALEFLRKFRDVSPSVLVLDVRMPGMSGVELQQRLAQTGWLIPIIFISGESQSQEIIEGMKGGAIEFLWKPFQMQVLLQAIDKGLRIDLEKRDLQTRSNQMRRMVDELSAREKDVFRLMLQGHGNKGIGEILNIQPDTIKKHRASILLKMHAEQLSDLLIMCKGLDIESML